MIQQWSKPQHTRCQTAAADASIPTIKRLEAQDGPLGVVIADVAAFNE
jgi:hypothetical protein